MLPPQQHSSSIPSQCGHGDGYEALGGWRFGNTINGAQAEYLLVPSAQANLAKIPDELTDEQVKVLAEKFRFTTVKLLPAQPYSLLQQYFLAAWPYYFIVVVSPLVCAFAIWLSRDRSFALLLFIHASILMVVVTALSPQACIRYLQPVSVLTLFSIAICVDWLDRRARPAAIKSATYSAALKRHILKLRARKDSNLRPTD